MGLGAEEWVGRWRGGRGVGGCAEGFEADFVSRFLSSVLGGGQVRVGWVGTGQRYFVSSACFSRLKAAYASFCESVRPLGTGSLDPSFSKFV